MSQIQSAPHTCDTCRQPIAVCDGISYGSLERGYHFRVLGGTNDTAARAEYVSYLLRRGQKEAEVPQ